MADRFQPSPKDRSGSRIWAKGDPCRVKWSGDNEYYQAKIKQILRPNNSLKLTALVHFDGFASEDDEEVEIEELEAPVYKSNRQKDSPIAGPSGLTQRESDVGTTLMFSSLRGDEEKERLSDKFRLWDEEEAASLVETPKRRNSWRSKNRTLLDVISTPPPKRTPQRKKPVVVKVLPGQRQQDAADGKAEAAASPNTPRTRKPITPVSTSTKKSSNFSLHLSESEEDENETESNFCHSGFADEDLEKPRFKHKPKSPKVPLVLSGAEVIKDVSIPATINQYLFEYQREGVRFLYDHYKKDEGAILGDDMGLGKTVQVISFLSALLHKTGTKKDIWKQTPKFIRRLSEEDYSSDDDDSERKIYLIIGPASVLYNWLDELETWGHFTVGKFHKNFKQQTIADLDKEKLDVVLTTYETCRDHLRELNRYNWDAVIADEAHKIKGMKAEITQALKALKCRRRYGLTGTALQNHMKELWCIFDWANPGCLGTVYQFEEKFEKVMLAGQKQDATKRQLAEARKAKEEFSALRANWFMRRTKNLIADQLPKKSEQVVYCRPTTFQLDVYKCILGHPDIQLILRQKEPCPCKSGLRRGKCHYQESEDGRTVNQLMFSYLHLLMKTANHVALLMPENTSNENQRRQAEDICDVAFAKHPHFREQTQKAAFRTLSDPKYCGKMKVLAGLLKVFKKENCKVLLFSLSTRLLDIIEQYVLTTGYEYRRLDGKVPEVKRVQLVHEFNRNADIFLFLSSTKAGGVGLNLTGANVVIIYDPNWNPTHDLQAQDRAYRLGQGRDVRIYRLITMGTIEENIYLRQVFKQQLDRIVVGEENAKRLFYENEIKGVANMFKLRSSDNCLTMDILERNEKIETSIRGFTVGRFIPPAPNKNALVESEEEKDERESDEDSSNDDEYGETQVILEDSDLSGGSESDASDRESQEKPESRNTKQTPSNDKPTRGIRSFSQFSDLFPCKQSSRGSAEPTPSTSRVSADRWTRKRSRPVHDLSSDEEEEEEVASTRRQNSTLGISASVNSVSDVFEHYDVPHMHENRKLIGASKAENHMTKCAIQDVYELHQYSQVPAAFCQPCSESSEESDDVGVSSAKKKEPSPVRTVEKTKKEPTSVITGAYSTVVNDRRVLVGQTPSAIRRKQFEQMAAFVNKDKVSLARAVLTSPKEDHGEFLKRFYVTQDDKLAQVFNSTEEDDVPNKTGKRREVGKKKQPSRRPSRRVSKAKGCDYDSEKDSEGEEGSGGRRRRATIRKKRLVVSSDDDVASRVSPELSSPALPVEEGDGKSSKPGSTADPPGHSEDPPRSPSPGHRFDLLDRILGDHSLSSSRKATKTKRERISNESQTFKSFMESVLTGHGSSKRGPSASSSKIGATERDDSILYELGILDDDRTDRKKAAKRRQYLSDTQSKMKANDQGNNYDDSNNLDLFSNECKVKADMSADRSSEWENELDAISPKKKLRKGRKI